MRRIFSEAYNDEDVFDRMVEICSNIDLDNSIITNIKKEAKKFTENYLNENSDEIEENNSYLDSENITRKFFDEYELKKGYNSMIDDIKLCSTFNDFDDKEDSVNNKAWDEIEFVKSTDKQDILIDTFVFTIFNTIDNIVFDTMTNYFMK